MIKLNPSPDIDINCPICKSTFRAEDWHITGLHNMVSGTCSNCSRKYFQEIPVNTGSFYPGTINAQTGNRVDEIPMDNWYLSGLVKSYNKPCETEYPVKVEKLKEFSQSKVVILNTIEHCYGHSLFELLNADYFLKDSKIDLVILVQEPLRWLVPDGVAQIWTISIPFSKGSEWHPWLEKKIKSEFQFIDNLYLANAFVQADSLDYEIEKFTRIKPFNLTYWDKLLEKPTITFIWRNDRFWRSVLPHFLENRYTKFFMGSFIENVKKRLQHRWILKFAKELKDQIPQVDFAIAGLDNQTLKIPSWIADFRFTRPNYNEEKQLCERYAKSHLIIGCNGSSLVLPGCLAGAIINIVPDDAWAQSAGSFPFRITSMGDTHFRYVMAPCEIKIKRLINISISILRDRSLIELLTSEPWRNHNSNQDYFALSRKRIEINENLKYFKSISGLVSRRLK